MASSTARGPWHAAVGLTDGDDLRVLYGFTSAPSVAGLMDDGYPSSSDARSPASLKQSDSRRTFLCTQRKDSTFSHIGRLPAGPSE
jgi:hypothetical protein